MNNGLILRCTVLRDRYDLDTSENIPFRLDISAIQNNSIGSNFGLASQNITLPGTKNNNKFFQAAFNVNSPNVRGFKRSIPCQVIQEGAAVFTGNLILNNVITDGVADTNYDITLVNETVDFATLVSEQYLSELDYSDLDHDFTPLNVTASFNSDNSFLNGDVYYPLVDYGVDGTVPDMYNMHFGGQVGKIDNQTTPMVIQQFKPAIRVKAVIDKIFDSVNYEYSSSFFDSPEFSSIYMLTTNNDKNGVTSNSSQDAGFRASSNFNQTIAGGIGTTGLVQFNTDIYDPLNQFNTTVSEFTAINSGQYAFSANIPFSKGAGVGFATFILRLKLNGTTIAQQVYPVTNTPNGTFGFSTAAVTLVGGDVIKLDFEWSAVDFYSGTPILLYLGASRTFSTLYAPIAVIGTNVNMAQQIDPTVKSLDFLKGIIEKFNLVIEPKKNERNTLIVEPFDVWADAGEVKDWSDKYDRAEKVSIKHPIASQPLKVTFNDSFDSDVLTTYAKENFNDERPYGSWTYTSNSDIPRGERKVGGFFAPLPTKGLPGADNIIVPQLYKLDTSGGRPYKFKPRLGYRINNQSAVGAASGEFYLKNPQGGNVLAINNYATISHLQQYPANGCNSLHFDGKWWPFHQSVSDGFTEYGTYNQYWSRYINELYDDDSRLLTLNMNFKPTDLIDIQLNDKIFIDNAYYRINKISGFNISNDDTVKVELLKAPLRKARFTKRRIWYWDVVDADYLPIDVYLGDGAFEPGGDVVVKNVDTDEIVLDEAILKKFASYEGYQFLSGSVKWKSEFNTDNLNVLETSTVNGAITVDSSAGVLLGAADSGSIGQNVDKVLVLGTQFDIERNVSNAILSGDKIILGQEAKDVSVLGSDTVTIGSSSFGAFAIGAQRSTVGGTRNGMIATLDSCIDCAFATEQVVMIGSEKMTLSPLSTYTRHVQIGGTDNAFYTNNPGTYRNNVMLGSIVGESFVSQGYPTSGSVYMGNSVQAGSVRYHIATFDVSPAANYNVVDHDYMILCDYIEDSTGYGTLTLPPVSSSIGRILHLNTAGTIAANKYVNVVANGLECNIDGSPEFPLNRSYDGITVTATPNYEWVIINRKSK